MVRTSRLSSCCCRYCCECDDDNCNSDSSYGHHAHRFQLGFGGHAIPATTIDGLGQGYGHDGGLSIRTCPARITSARPRRCQHDRTNAHPHTLYLCCAGTREQQQLGKPDDSCGHSTIPHETRQLLGASVIRKHGGMVHGSEPTPPVPHQRKRRRRHAGKPGHDAGFAYTACL